MRASCIYQLIYIIHEIYRVFNCSLLFEVRGIFLDLLKIFDKIWHQRILFKLESFTIRGKWLSNKFQKILLNDQESNWFPINGGLLQGSVVFLLFLIYINALPEGINSNAELFVNDASLLPIVQDLNESDKYLNLDLSVISLWAYQWKMPFNPHPKKAAHKVTFFRKPNEETHPSFFYNNIEVSGTDSQKHLDLVLENKLTFKKHIKDKSTKVYSGVIKIKRLRDILPRDSVVTIYKSFIRPHLDSCDVVSDQTNNDSFFDKIEQLQYKACLEITGDIQRTSREYFYDEL